MQMHFADGNMSAHPSEVWCGTSRSYRDHYDAYLVTVNLPVHLPYPISLSCDDTGSIFGSLYGRLFNKVQKSKKSSLTGHSCVVIVWNDKWMTWISPPLPPLGLIQLVDCQNYHHCIIVTQICQPSHLWNYLLSVTHTTRKALIF